MRSRLTFHGGAGSVTGSNFLLDTGGAKILVDCGFFQGGVPVDKRNELPFSYDPKAVDALFITHAHLDHTGRIPKLVRDGFRGTIFSTAPTKDLAALVLRDSLEILEREGKEKKREVLYGEKDIARALGLWKTVGYHEEISLPDGLSAELKNTGHILGSAMIEFSRGDAQIVFTGDLGNTPDPILPDFEPLLKARYLVIEGVYGDTIHEGKDSRRDQLEDIVEGVIRKNGVLLIPAFSVERTQKMLFEIKTMMGEKRIPSVPVFLDSPLAIEATDLYGKYQGFLRKSVRDGANDGTIFSFPELRKTLTREESEGIARTPNPKIIIAGSGMSHGGRVLYHEKKYLPDASTTILLVGYQSPGSLGRALEEGARTVSVFKEKIAVGARVEKVTGYSAHADMDSLFAFVVQVADTAQKIFVVNAEPKTGAFFTQRLRDYLGIAAIAPQEGDSTELEL